MGKVVSIALIYGINIYTNLGGIPSVTISLNVILDIWVDQFNKFLPMFL